MIKFNLLLMATVMCSYASYSYSDTVNLEAFNSDISIKMPDNFKSVNEKTLGKGYLFTATPFGKPLEESDEIITITSQKDLALTPGYNMPKVASIFFKGFSESCKNSFSAGKVPEINSISGYPATTLILRCGSLNSISETLVVNFIESKTDFYTIQYLQKSTEKPKLNTEDINSMVKKDLSLFPIRICNKESISNEFCKKQQQGDNS